jgi:alkyldihydroxyacetonephosphate synthase
MTSTLGRALADAVGPLGVLHEGTAFVVRPGAPPEVGAVLGIARERRVPVLPVGAGSLSSSGDDADVSGGGGGRKRRSKARIILDTRRMSNVLHIDEHSLTVHAQAGLLVGALEQTLNARKLTLGDWPVATYRSTLGGALSARAPGRATSRLGPIETTCIGLSAVLADGRILHVKAAPRRSTGPDLMRLFLGAEGALGIITAAVVRISRTPERRVFQTHVLPSIELALAAARQALRRGARPAAMRVYDAEAAATHGLAAAAPPPTGVTAAAWLLGCHAGADPLIEAEQHVLAQAALARGSVALGPAPAEKWWSSRTADAVAPGEAPFQVAAPLAKLAAVYLSVRASLLAAGCSAQAYVAHFHEDGGCVYFFFPRATATDAIAREAAVAAGGRPAAELEVDPPLAAALGELKRLVDPHTILIGGAVS